MGFLELYEKRHPRKGKKMAYVPHEIVQDGDRVYVKRAGRTPLGVWPIESCREKLLKKSNPTEMQKFFADLAAWAGEAGDPMMIEWRRLCFDNCEKAWEQINTEEVEEFGI